LRHCGSGTTPLVGRDEELDEWPGSLRSTITHCVGTGGTNVSAEARAVAGAGATKDQLEEIVADESLGLLDHYRIIRGALYKSLSAAAELGDRNSLALLAGRLHENFRDCGRLTGELQRGPLLVNRFCGDASSQSDRARIRRVRNVNYESTTASRTLNIRSLILFSGMYLHVGEHTAFPGPAAR
jgi:hypothetical protein